MTGPGTETEVLAALDSVVLDAWADVEQGADRDQVAVAYAMGLSVAAATLGRPSEVWASPDRDESVAARLAARTLRVWRAGDPEPKQDVRAVLDREGDLWQSSPTGWWYSSVDDVEDWATMMEFDGPLVEVILPEPVTE